MKLTCLLSGTLITVFCVADIGCSSSSTKDETPVGVLQVGPYSLDIHQERDAVAPGATSRFVIKASGGTPTSITGWIGMESAAGSAKKLATFDPGDSDYDDDVVAPTPIPPGSKFWVEVDTNGKKDVASIAWKK